MMQNAATLTEKQHKSSEMTSNDHNVHFKSRPANCLMSNISKGKPFRATVTIKH